MTELDLDAAQQLVDELRELIWADDLGESARGASVIRQSDAERQHAAAALLAQHEETFEQAIIPRLRELADVVTLLGLPMQVTMRDTGFRLTGGSPWKQVRDDVLPTVQRRLGHMRNGTGVVQSTSSRSLDGLHGLVEEAASAAYERGDYAEAIRNVAREVCALIKRKIDRPELKDGTVVHEQAWTPQDPQPGKARLRPANVDRDRVSDETWKAYTVGTQQLGKGLQMRTRNLLEHEDLALTAQEAFEILAAWSAYARMVDQAKVEQ